MRAAVASTVRRSRANQRESDAENDDDEENEKEAKKRINKTIDTNMIWLKNYLYYICTCASSRARLYGEHSYVQQQQQQQSSIVEWIPTYATEFHT